MASKVPFRELVRYAIGGGWGTDEPTADSLPVRVIRGTDFAKIASGAFDEIPRRFEVRAKVERRLLQANDIVLEISGGSRTSNQTTGQTLFVTQTILDRFEEPVIPASFCRLVRVRDDVVVPRYAYFVLQEMYNSGRAGLYEHHSTGISNFQFEYFLDQEVVWLPPLPEQRAIAHILGTLDDKIELNRRMSQTLEAMARALFKSWFVDFEPVRAKMEGRWQRGQSLPGLPAHLYDLFPDRLVDSELGPIPEGWKVGTLADHFDAVKGVSYKGSSLSNSGVPLHNLNSIYEGGGYKYEGIKFYAGEYSGRHIVRPGDVIVANTEQGHDRLLIGYAAIVPRLFGDHGIVSHHIYRLRPKPDGLLPSTYLCHLLNSPQMHDIVSGYANGTTVNMLPIDAVQKLKIVCPPPEVVAAFDALATNVEHRREEIVAESRTLAALRDALLPKLIRGEIRVKDAEQFLKERGL
jgi:type I restriction enzyme S subunit